MCKKGEFKRVINPLGADTPITIKGVIGLVCADIPLIKSILKNEMEEF